MDKDFDYFSITYTETQKNIVRSEYNVLLYCEEGTALVEINYQKYSITPRTTMMIVFKDIVSRLYVSKDFRARCIAFLPSLVMTESRNYDFSFLAALQRHPVISWEGKYAKFVEQLFTTIAMTEEFADADFLRKTALCQYYCYMKMLRNYFQNNNQLTSDASHPLSCKKDYFMAFIKELFVSCRRSREVLFYATSLNISSNYLNEVCQTVCEHSAKEVIDQYISSQLKFELLHSNKTIQQLTEEYNFPNQSYLSRYYRRMMGETPSQTRRKRTDKHIMIF